jgi:hypothetical protein
MTPAGFGPELAAAFEPALLLAAGGLTAPELVGQPRRAIAREFIRPAGWAK